LAPSSEITVASNRRRHIWPTSLLIAVFIAGSTPHGAAAQTQDTTLTAAETTAVAQTTTFGAYVDGYYAWDFSRPPTLRPGIYHPTGPARRVQRESRLHRSQARRPQGQRPARHSVRHVRPGELRRRAAHRAHQWPGSEPVHPGGVRRIQSSHRRSGSMAACSSPIPVSKAGFRETISRTRDPSSPSSHRTTRPESS
jgi:hypothetical protein